MQNDKLQVFLKGMDGEWEVTSIANEEHDAVRVTYTSVTIGGLTWSHRPIKGSKLPPLGTRGRIGFIGNIQ